MRCQERSGFLFAHACDQGATQVCSRCSKSVCKDHLRPGTICVTCERAGLGPEQAQQLRGSRDDRYRDDPYFYPYAYHDDYHYYDDRDQRVFDPQSEAAAADLESDFDGS